MDRTYNDRNSYALALSLLPALLLASSKASASLTELDVQSILVNLQSIVNPIMVLLLSISFIIGIFMIIKGLMQLKAFALPLTQATRPGELAGPMISIFVGAVLIYIPTSTNVLSSTFFGSGVASIFPGASGANTFSPDLSQMGNASDVLMGYASITIESQWATMINTIVLYMELIGFIAFLRGWMLISHHGHGGQPGDLSKGIVHVVGGILAINFLPLVTAVANTINGTS